MLTNLFEDQNKFTIKALATLDGVLYPLSDEQKIKYTKDYIEYLHAELVEVLNNVPWKKHRYTGKTDRHALVEELIDVQKFLWGLMSIWEVDEEEFAEVYKNKTLVVEQRFKQEHVFKKELSDTEKIAVIDIDDVIANWRQGFSDWVTDNYTYNTTEFAPNTALRELLKVEARQNGIMRTLKLKEGVLDGLGKLNQAGYLIVFLTARPVSECPRLITDTIVWLAEHNLPSSYVYFSDANKHIFIMDNFPNAKVLFDDDDMIIAKAKKSGYNAIKVTTTLEKAVDEFLWKL